MRGRPRKIKEEVISQPIDEIQPSQQGPFEESGVTTLEKPKGISNEKDEYTVQIIDDKYSVVDITIIENPDPRYAYRWLNSKDEKNMLMKTGPRLHAHGGWQLVDREHAMRIGLKNYIGPDGIVRRAELALSFMRKELYEKKMKRQQERNNAPMKEIERLVAKGDPDSKHYHGLAGLGHPDMKGLQTKEKLGFE